MNPDAGFFADAAGARSGLVAAAASTVGLSAWLVTGLLRSRCRPKGRGRSEPNSATGGYHIRL